MSNVKILIVEDDKHIFKLIQYNLTKAGFDSIVTVTGEDALETLERDQVDLILLDIMLPKMDGFEFCKEVKKDSKFSQIPIIMLTAKGEEVDKVLGFELGADDYIVKPFSVRELILRIKAILKRGKEKEVGKDVMEVENIKLDVKRHEVTASGKELKLTLMEFKLLKVLMSRKGRVQSRDRLLEDVWDMAADVTTRTIDTHIKHLRKKLGKSGKLIETIRGLGYKIKDED